MGLSELRVLEGGDTDSLEPQQEGEEKGRAGQDRGRGGGVIWGRGRGAGWEQAEGWN